MDRIDIEGLEVKAIIGIFDWERKRKQKVRLDLTLFRSTRKAARTDSIKDALDYKAVSKRLLKFVGNSEFFLLERLAEEVANILLSEFGTKHVIVKASKPGALRHSKNVSITIERKKR